MIRLITQENICNILNGHLPCCVNVNGIEYPVKTSFKDWIDFFVLHENSDISSEDKIMRSMSLYTGSHPPDILNAYEALQNFSACDDMPKNTESKNRTGAFKAPVFSYLYDSVYIYGDFMKHYGIDLRKSELHWYEFSALLIALPDKSETKQRIAYRSINASEINSKERRLQIMRVQESIRIPHENITASEIGDKLWQW